jgi:hypothetical protein
MINIKIFIMQPADYYVFAAYPSQICLKIQLTKSLTNTTDFTASHQISRFANMLNWTG